MFTNRLLCRVSHELPDDVFQPGETKPVKQTKKKIIKKKVSAAATNGGPTGKKRNADEVCINLSRKMCLLLPFREMGEEGDRG